MNLDPRIFHYDMAELLEVTALFHDRMFQHESYFDRKLAIPRSGEAHGMTIQWNHVETPITLIQTITLCEAFHAIVQGIHAGLTGEANPATFITHEDFKSKYESQLEINRKQSELIAELTSRLVEAGVQREPDRN